MSAKKFQNAVEKAVKKCLRDIDAFDNLADVMSNFENPRDPLSGSYDPESRRYCCWFCYLIMRHVFIIVIV
jgi:hypothetical protein